MSPEKITPILNYKTPKSVPDVRRLIGMASWYRRFIPNFSKIIVPISDLISKSRRTIKWNEEAEEAFKKLKLALVSEPVLVPPNFDNDFTIQCDASDVEIAGVLTQTDDEGNERVISYYSKKLTKAEKKYTVKKKKCLAVLQSIEHFRPYVNRSSFVDLVE
jgi:RNase H-like domain found in reverse transcriptase